MKRLSICMVVLLCMASAAFSQIEEKMKTEGAVAGAVIINGQEIPGYIKQMGTAYTNQKVFQAPWQFQSDFRFIDKEKFENSEKLKNKDWVKYESKDCEGYIYDTLYFESVQFSDMSAVGLNMLPKSMFMRRISVDKISIYHYFSTPPSVVGAEGFEPYYIECAVVNLVYKLGSEGRLKRVEEMNIEKELADCPFVVDKQSRGEYKVVGEEGEATGFNKVVNNTAFREEVRMLAIDDYNKNCK